MRRRLRVRWPLLLAASGLALVTAALALAVSGGEATLGPRTVIQVGGVRPGDAVRAVSTPVLASDPQDPNRVLLANRVEWPEFGCAVFASTDGGATWKASRYTLPKLGNHCYGPSVAFGAAGRAHLFITMLAGKGNHPVAGFLYTSNDGGQTFGQPRRVLPRSSFDARMTAGSNGTVALVSVSANEFSSHTNLGYGPTPNPITLRVSRDDGRSFGPPRIVQEDPLARVGGASLAIGAKGEIRLLHWEYGDDVFDYHGFPGRYRDHFQLVFAITTDGGRSFRRRIVEPAAVPSRPFLIYLPPLAALAVDPRGSRLYAAWEDGRSGSGDVLVRRSLDDGRTWSRAELLFSSPAEERMPALALEKSSVIAAAYRIHGGAEVEVVGRRSDDGGETFSDTRSLSPDRFDGYVAPRLPGRRDQIDLGSTIAVARPARDPLVAWSDGSGGTQETGKVDILVAPVPDELPGARRLGAAAPAPSPRSAVSARLSGPCRKGSALDSRASPSAVVRSFLSSLDHRDLRRAYGYLDRAWKRGAQPSTERHTFADFTAEFGSLGCARPAKIVVMGEDTWRTMAVWAALRRSGGPTRLLVGNFWARSPTGRAPWSLAGYWTHEVSRRVTASAARGNSSESAVAARWIDLTLDEVAAHRLSAPRAARALALLSAAVDAAVRAREGNADDAVPAAAATVLGFLFPDGAEEFRQAASTAGRGRRAGLRIGARLVARARTDGAAARWLGRAPLGRRFWRETTAAGPSRALTPLAGTWKPWALKSGAEFRPPLPPLPGTPRFEREMRAVLAVSRQLTGEQMAIADKWADGPGTATPSGHWNRIALELVRTDKLSTERTARLFALLNMAQADAFIACWDAKYAYWLLRPVTAIRRQLDSDWTAYLPTPPFPAYPSGHATTSAAAAEVLAHFFPAEAKRLRAMAREAALSRIYGGIHFPVDSEAGLALGRKVARAVLARRG